MYIKLLTCCLYYDKSRVVFISCIRISKRLFQRVLWGCRGPVSRRNRQRRLLRKQNHSILASLTPRRARRDGVVWSIYDTAPARRVALKHDDKHTEHGRRGPSSVAGRRIRMPSSDGSGRRRQDRSEFQTRSSPAAPGAPWRFAA